MFAAFVFAAFFYGVAEYEHLTGWKWALASLAITFTIMQLTEFLLFAIPGQLVLFGFLWRAHLQRQAKLPEERAARAEADRQMRQERVRQAREQADRNQPRR